MGVNMRKRKLLPSTLERYNKILEQRESGMTYQAIGDEHGFTRARAFAICDAARKARQPEEDEPPSEVE